MTCQLKKMYKTLFFCGLLFLSVDGYSQRTWIGAVDSDWENAANWNGGTLPSNGDDVRIDGDDYTFAPTITGNSSFTIDDLTIIDAGVLNKSGGSLTVTDDITVDNGTFNNTGGNLSVDEMKINNSSNVTLSGGTITMSGDLDGNSGSTINISTTVTNTSGDEDIELGANTTVNILPGANITGFDDIDLDNGGGGSTFNMTGGILDIDDDLKIDDGDNQTVSISGGTFTLGDDFSIETDNNNISFSGDADINIGDDLDFGGDNSTFSTSGTATIDIAEDIQTDGSGNTITLGGSSVVNSGGIDDFSVITQIENVSGNVGGTPLPVEFLSISTSLTYDGKVTVMWSTASEINNDFFTVEKSTDLEIWEELGVVLGAGTSFTELNYSFIDDSSNTGTVYYRIKQTDFNNHVEYSDVVSESLQTSQSIEVNVYPNPSTEIITIQLENGNLNTINIYNSQGHNVMNLSQSLVTNTNKVTINISHFPGGIYIIRGESFPSTFISQ